MTVPFFIHQKPLDPKLEMQGVTPDTIKYLQGMLFLLDPGHTTRETYEWNRRTFERKRRRKNKPDHDTLTRGTISIQ